jgi:hypothetical protein
MASGLGALTLSPTAIGFNPQGTAMVPVTGGGGQKLGTISIKSPMDTLKEVFFDIRDRLGVLVEQAKVTLGLEKKKDVRDKLKGMDTDKDKPGEGLTMKETLQKMMGELREGFDKVDFGDKMKALVLTGMLLLFNKYKDLLIPVIEKIVEGIKAVMGWLGGKGITGEHTLMGLFAGILLIKLAPVIKSVYNVGKYLGGKFIGGIKLLGGAFKSMRLYMTKTLIPAIARTYGGAKGLLMKAVSRLGLAFTAMRTFMIATMLPALTGMMASMSAMLVPLAPFLLIVAGVALLLASLKSGFDTFQQSLEDGDSMMTAILKGLGDVIATLWTLPLTLVKSLVAWFADMLGFTHVAEYLREIDFKQALKDAFVALFTKVKDFIGAIFDFDLGEFFGKVGNIAKQLTTMLKAVALGALAAIKAAWPGGESPGSAYKRVYKEVMQGAEDPVLPEEKGSGDTKIAEPAIIKEVEKETKEFDDSGEGAMATAKAAVTTNQAYSYDNRTFNKTTNIMREKIIELLKQQLDLEIFKFKYEKERDKAIMVSNVKHGDVVNQMQNTNVVSDLEVNNTEYTQKAINEAVA